MATNLPSCFSIQFLEQLLKFLVNFTLLKYVKSQRSYGFLITKELIFGFQILDLKYHLSASLKIVSVHNCIPLTDFKSLYNEINRKWFKKVTRPLVSVHKIILNQFNAKLQKCSNSFNLVNSCLVSYGWGQIDEYCWFNMTSQSIIQCCRGWPNCPTCGVQQCVIMCIEQC